MLQKKDKEIAKEEFERLSDISMELAKWLASKDLCAEEADCVVSIFLSGMASNASEWIEEKISKNKNCNENMLIEAVTLNAETEKITAKRWRYFLTILTYVKTNMMEKNND